MMPSPGHWTRDAACQGLAPVNPVTDTDDPFFSQPRNGTHMAMQSMCHACPVKMQCRMEGYGEEHGRWGNASERHRNRTRIDIFGRVYGRMTQAQDTGLFEEWMSDFRELVRLLAGHPSGDMGEAMKDYGFNDREISMFTKDTAWDRDAKRYASKRKFWTGA